MICVDVEGEGPEKNPLTWALKERLSFVALSVDNKQACPCREQGQRSMRASVDTHTQMVPGTRPSGEVSCAVWLVLIKLQTCKISAQPRAGKIRLSCTFKYARLLEIRLMTPFYS